MLRWRLGSVLFNWTMDLVDVDRLWIEPSTDSDIGFLMLGEFGISNNSDIAIKLNRSIDLNVINGKVPRVNIHCR